MPFRVFFFSFLALLVEHSLDVSEHCWVFFCEGGLEEVRVDLNKVFLQDLISYQCLPGSVVHPKLQRILLLGLFLRIVQVLR